MRSFDNKFDCSLRMETVSIVGRKEFEIMKEGVTIVNTARGKLIDEQALVGALESGKVWSAGLVVYKAEPKIHQGLLDNPNVALLSHIGTATMETQVCLFLCSLRKRVGDESYREILANLKKIDI
jgi:glyoxylate reductase